jgi:hypothetical protein
MKQPSRPKLSGHHSSYQHDLETQADLQVAMARASARKVCLASILFHNPSDQALEVHIERQEDATGKQHSFVNIDTWSLRLDYMSVDDLQQRLTLLSADSSLPKLLNGK